MTHVSDAIRAARIASGLTMDALGRKLHEGRTRAFYRGTERNMIYQYEHGHRRPSAIGAALLARAMGLPPWHFDDAMMRDVLEQQCRPEEMTLAVVGIERHIRSMSGEQWAGWLQIRAQAKGVSDR